MRSECVQSGPMMEIEAAKALLAEHGIRAVVIPHRESAITVTLGGGDEVDLLVMAEDLPRARELLGLDKPRPQSLAALSEQVQAGLARGRSQAEMAQWLMEKGWAEAGARRLVADKAHQLKLKDDAPPATQRAGRSGLRRMLSGLLWIVAGVVLTIGSQQLAQAQGGIQIIWWGAILWGLVDFVAGLVDLLKHK